MKLLKFIMFILYRYYSRGRYYNTPYLSTLSVVMFSIWLHYIQLILLFNKIDLIPLKRTAAKDENLLKTLLYILPIALVIVILIKPKDLQQANYDEDKIRRGGIYLVIYYIISWIVLLILALVSPLK